MESHKQLASLTALLGLSSPLLAQEHAPAAVVHEATAAAHGEAAEAHGGHKGGLLDPDLGTAFFTILVFLGLVLVLRATAWKPILTSLKQREVAIREGLEAATNAKKEAEKAARDLEAKMAEAQRQYNVQITQAKNDAVALAASIKLQAETESAALRDRTLREIEAAKSQALSEINAHAADLGSAIARRILQRQITQEDQNRLVSESLAQLELIGKS